MCVRRMGWHAWHIRAGGKARSSAVRQSCHAFAAAQCDKVATPVDWKNGDDCIIVPNLDDIQAKELFPNGWNALKPYLRLVSDPTKQDNE